MSKDTPDDMVIDVDETGDADATRQRSEFDRQVVMRPLEESLAQSSLNGRKEA
jgi:hypothetical protein